MGVVEAQRRKPKFVEENKPTICIKGRKKFLKRWVTLISRNKIRLSTPLIKENWEEKNGRFFLKNKMTF